MFPIVSQVASPMMTRTLTLTHQVVQHPHQRLKLHLAELPLMSGAHVDRHVLDDALDLRFQLGRVQQDQVVHAAGARHGLHLRARRAEGEARETQNKQKHTLLSSNICGIGYEKDDVYQKNKKNRLPP